MKCTHAVKINGKWYEAGDEAPETVSKKETVDEAPETDEKTKKASAKK